MIDRYRFADALRVQTKLADARSLCATTADPYLTVTTTPEGKEWALGVLGSLAMPAITDGAES